MAPRLPSEYPFPLRLSPWEAFRFNAGVLRASQRARRNTLSEASRNLKNDDFGIGTITGTLGALYAKG